MLDVNTHCTMLNEQLRDRNTTIMEGFKSFVTTFTAIAGGSVALKASSLAVTASIVVLSDLLVILCGAASAIIIADNYRAWFQYRQRLSQIAGMTDSKEFIVPPPNFRSPVRIELTMLIVVAAASALFVIFNPLAG